MSKKLILICSILLAIGLVIIVSESNYGYMSKIMSPNKDTVKEEIVENDSLKDTTIIIKEPMAQITNKKPPTFNFNIKPTFDTCLPFERGKEEIYANIERSQKYVLGVVDSNSNYFTKRIEILENKISDLQKVANNVDKITKLTQSFSPLLIPFITFFLTNRKKKVEKG